MHEIEAGLKSGIVCGVEERVIANLPTHDADRSAEPCTYVLLHGATHSQRAIPLPSLHLVKNTDSVKPAEAKADPKELTP